MNRDELDRNLVTILNEHRHEQMDTEKAMHQLKQVFAAFFGQTISKCTCKGFQRSAKCPVHGITNVKSKAI